MQWSWIVKKSKTAKKGSASADTELAKRLRQRDERAFLRLYDLHRSAVFRFLMHTTGSIAAAEELTQEVFVVILDAICDGTIGQFDPKKGTWEGYLLGIARNLARTEKRKIHRVVSLDSILETPEWKLHLRKLCKTNHAGDIEGLVAMHSELSALSRAILELPDHYREAVVLCSLQEKSYRDAAAILQCSEGTVASRMNRAKALLAVKLRGSPPGKVNAPVLWRRKEGTDVRTAVKTNRN